MPESSHGRGQWFDPITTHQNQALSITSGAVATPKPRHTAPQRVPARYGLRHRSGL